MIRYAVVPAPGCYPPGSRVHAVRVLSTLEKALEVSERLTAAYRRSQEPQHGASGGFRVVATDGRISWLGRELDGIPSALP